MKKGQLEAITIPIIILILGVSIFAGVIALKYFMEEYQFLDEVNYNRTVTNIDNTVLAMDFILPMALIGIGIGIIVSSYFIYSHPVLYIVGLFSIAIGIMVSATVSNVFYELNATGHTYLGGALTTSMALTQYVPHVLFALLVIGAIVLYSKGSGTSGGV